MVNQRHQCPSCRGAVTGERVSTKYNSGPIRSACRPFVNAGSPTFSKPINFGIEGPKMSRSRRPTCKGLGPNLFKANEIARFTVKKFQDWRGTMKHFFIPATVLLPTPPLPLATAMTRFTCGIGCLTGGPPPLEGIFGGILSPERGRPY